MADAYDREVPDDSPPPLHGLDPATEQMAHRVFEYVLERIKMSPPPLDGPLSAAELHAATGDMTTESGLGYEEAAALFSDVLAPACISSDHPRYLAFVPTAPSEAATLFDLVVSASSIYGDWWLEGAGAIHAENETLRWMGRLAGLPEGAGGVFVSGGTSGNLAALTTAREQLAALADPALLGADGSLAGGGRDELGADLDPHQAPAEPHEQTWSGLLTPTGDGGFVLEQGSSRWPVITLEPALHAWLQQMSGPRQLSLVGCANPWGPWLRVSRLAN